MALEAYCTSGTSPTEHTLTGPPEAPTVLVLGGISARADLAWWRDLVGPRRAIDTDRYRVLTLAFSGLPTREQAAVVLDLLDELGIDLHASVGCSYGGMVCLALAELAPERVGHVVVVGATHRPHALATAWRLVQRRILDLGNRAGDPALGVALARMLAMTTYRSDRELDGRFDPTSLEAWLEHHGDRYAHTVPAPRYAALSAAIDGHRIDPTTVDAPVTLIGFDSDLLAPPWLIEELASELPRLEALHVLPSLHGHDAFLLEVDALAPLLSQSLEVAA